MKISSLLNGRIPPLHDLNINYITMEESTAEWGTADILRHIEEKINVRFELWI